MPLNPFTRASGRFLMLFVTALALPSTAFAQTSSLLSGTVTDAATGAALPGVRVGIGGSSRAAITDERGYYRLEGFSAGEYTVTASHLGSEPAAQTIRVPASGVVTANFSLKPGSVLLSDVVVSASRLPQSPRQVAATVNVMSREQVRTNPARVTDDLLREMPGVELPRTSSTVSGPEEIVSIRGADEGRTLVLLDNVPLNDPWGEWIQWNRAPRFQLDRVEVVEGGGSSLYGNYGMGGVVALSSLPIVRRGYNLMASGGSRSAGEFSLYGSDLHGRLGLSLSGDYGTGGGYTVLRPRR